MQAISARQLSLVVATSIFAALTAGCGEPVREDRTIEFSRDGKEVAFQHGNEGVYVADSHGEGATRIFQPDETVLATGRPLPCPVDGRLIFTTAHGLNGETRTLSNADGPLPAEGRVVSQIPVRYTCHLRDASDDNQPPEVRELFSVTCGHIGYVSAGLAVRWHPDGKSILYVAAVDTPPSRHTIFEFELESGQSRRVFPYAADAILCDWSPAGGHLTCVVGDAADREPGREPAATAGIWIGTPGDDKSWWHVPDSQALSQGELPSLIEALRASRPAWTRDDAQFAFASQLPVDPNGNIARHRLNRVEPACRNIAAIVEADGPITDLAWAPDGSRLGFVERPRESAAAIMIVEADGSITKRPVSGPVRKFAGFDATGERLAYIVSEAIDKPPQSTWWALLLIPDPLARDSVWIAQADSTSPGTEVFSGMRVTFPLWSPTEGRLSLWLTFTPRFRSLLSILRGWGLWPGDPAATLDVATGAVSWLAVTPQEELQVGHYHLLKHGYNEAWQWYAKAREKMSPAKPPESWTEFARRIGAPENSQLFEFICLQKLGRAEGTLEKYEEFERNFFPPARGLPPGGQSHDPVGALLEAAGPQGELLKRLIRDLYVAEVFLSVDAVNEAVAHFRDAPRTPADDAARFSRALVLAQLLLISGDHDGYLAHVTDVVLPLALRMWESAAHGQSGSANFVLQIAGGLCVAPLFHPDFVAGLNEELVKADVVVWESCRESLGDGQLALAVDLVLRAAARSLGDEILKQAANDRIARNPAGRELFAGKNIDEVVAGWFAQAGEWQR